jgi:hypothetical protein
MDVFIFALSFSIKEKPIIPLVSTFGKESTSVSQYGRENCCQPEVEVEVIVDPSWN